MGNCQLKPDEKTFIADMDELNAYGPTVISTTGTGLAVKRYGNFYNINYHDLAEEINKSVAAREKTNKIVGQEPLQPYHYIMVLINFGINTPWGHSILIQKEQREESDVRYHRKEAARKAAEAKQEAEAREMGAKQERAQVEESKQLPLRTSFYEAFPEVKDFMLKKNYTEAQINDLLFTGKIDRVIQAEDQKELARLILQLPESPTSTQVSSQFRHLAKHYHPDINKNPQAAEIYKMVVQAESILTK